MKSAIVHEFFGGLLAILIAALVPCPASAADKVRIDGLSDIAFGTISNFAIDQKVSQNLCLYSSSPGGLYSVTGIGSGVGGAFTLSSGSQILPYEVQWAASAGQASGNLLAANVALTGLPSAASNQNCNPSPPSTATLIVILRSIAVSSATAGTYGGTLTLIIGAN